MTYTYATLEVSAAAYDEIAAKLRAVDYGHVINDRGEMDMHGIALTRADPVTSCDHTCAFHLFKQRAVGSGPTNLLTTRNNHTMTETRYLMGEAEAAEWCGRLCGLDVIKFDDLLMSGLTLEQAWEQMKP